MPCLSSLISFFTCAEHGGERRQGSMLDHSGGRLALSDDSGDLTMWEPLHEAQDDDLLLLIAQLLNRLR